VTISVGRVQASVALPLRQRVLRPHQTVDELAVEDRELRDLVYFAAVEDDTVVGVASVCREAPPWDDQSIFGWRLRSMATEDRCRGRGVGTAVLRAVILHVGTYGGGLLWCSARTPAQVFYERAGFAVTGDPWVDPVLGPHVAMQRRVEPG
jgi:GNAT superfamily N-acetyltransferase